MSKKPIKVTQELFELSEKHGGTLKEITIKLIENLGAQRHNPPGLSNVFSNMMDSTSRSHIKQKKPPSKKQLKSLAAGRKKLKETRNMSTQVLIPLSQKKES